MLYCSKRVLKCSTVSTVLCRCAVRRRCRRCEFCGSKTLTPWTSGSESRRKNVEQRQRQTSTQQRGTTRAMNNT